MSLINLLKQANSYMGSDDYGAAKECLENALDLSADENIRGVIYEQLSMCCINLKDTEGAMLYLELLILNEKNEGIYDASVSLAKLYRDAGRFDDMYRIGKKISTLLQPENSLKQPEQLYYELWCKQNEPEVAELERQRNYKFGYKPKISIVVPVYNVNIELLEEMLDSVCSQTYSNWELCIADGNSTNEDIREAILKYAEGDQRIRYIFLNENLGISENTNAAIVMSDGEYIAFLDHDDVLSKDALFEVAKALDNNREIELIYSDHDLMEMTETGYIRTTPQFKPDWSPILFEQINYIIHFVVVKQELLERVGLLRREYDICQDTELLFRITENTDKILHIPKILYSWRMHGGGVGFAIKSDKLTNFNEIMSSVKAAHFERINIQHQRINSGYINIMIRDNPKVSIIIINKNNFTYLNRCIESIFMKAGYNNYEIIIIDKNSTEQDVLLYYEALKQMSPTLVSVIYDTDENNTGGRASDYNFGAENATGEYLVFMSGSCEFQDNDWLYLFLMTLQYKNVGLTGCGVNYIDETGKRINFSGIQFTGSCCEVKHIYDNKRKKVILCPDEIVRKEKRLSFHNATALDSICVIIKKELFDSVCGFDIRFSNTFYVYNLCLKLNKANYFNVWINELELNYTQEKDVCYADALLNFETELKLFESIYKNELEKEDPFMNVNYSPDNYDKNSCFFNIQIGGENGFN